MASSAGHCATPACPALKAAALRGPSACDLGYQRCVKLDIFVDAMNEDLATLNNKLGTATEPISIAEVHKGLSEEGWKEKMMERKANPKEDEVKEEPRPANASSSRGTEIRIMPWQVTKLQREVDALKQQIATYERRRQRSEEWTLNRVSILDEKLRTVHEEWLDVHTELHRIRAQIQQLNPDARHAEGARKKAEDIQAEPRSVLARSRRKEQGASARSEARSQDEDSSAASRDGGEREWTEFEYAGNGLQVIFRCAVARGGQSRAARNREGRPRSRTALPRSKPPPLRLRSRPRSTLRGDGSRSRSRRARSHR